MLSMNPSGSVSLSVLTSNTLLSAVRPRASFIPLNLLSVQNPHAFAGDRVGAGEEKGSCLSQDWPTLHTGDSTAQAGHD